MKKNTPPTQGTRQSHRRRMEVAIGIAAGLPLGLSPGIYYRGGVCGRVGGLPLPLVYRWAACGLPAGGPSDRLWVAIGITAGLTRGQAPGLPWWCMRVCVGGIPSPVAPEEDGGYTHDKFPRGRYMVRIYYFVRSSFVRCDDMGSFYHKPKLIRNHEFFMQI